ncbi:hypothetical protein I3842_13G029000 [Carya illinoinensis]|uniref:Uncharacterized protein n=1 Tax=Carya illinoinensis TaxID=32201 RepID=A0A922DDD9_CARIL|nr:hypothetical protein I3842_13G029000 [Carya illinoinensis]
MDHLIPLIEFAKLLALHHGFGVKCIFPTIGGLPTNIDHIFLPPVSPKDLEEAQPGSLFEMTRLVAPIFDPFASDVLEVAKELKLSPYFFIPTNAMLLSLLLHLLTLDETIPCQYRDLPKPLKLLGCIPIHNRDLINLVQDWKSKLYKIFIRHSSGQQKRLPLAKGIMVNTFINLERRVIKALEENEVGYPPIYPVRPIIQSGSSTDDEDDESGCLRCGGTLSYDQINDLALGLESSGQKFLWSHDDPLTFLPQGFLARTKGQEQRMNAVLLAEDLKVALRPKANEKGLVDREEIAKGKSVCKRKKELRIAAKKAKSADGSSKLALKLSFNRDHFMALRLKIDEKAIVNREDIAKVIKRLMVGEEGKMVHNRMKELKIVVEKALSEDSSSIRSLSEFASKLASDTY